MTLTVTNESVSSSSAPLPGCNDEGEAVGVAQDEGAVGMAAGLIGIEAEVALVEAARAHLIGDADPDMSEAHGQQNRRDRRP
jgi:hypothetical protein